MKRHSVSLVSPQWSHAQLLLQRHQTPVGLPVDPLAPSCGCMAQLYSVTLAAMVFFFFFVPHERYYIHPEFTRLCNGVHNSERNISDWTVPNTTQLLASRTKWGCPVFASAQVFRPRTPPEAIALCSRLLEYTPTARLTPLEACAHSFFDELRDPNIKLPNGREKPSLFNFTTQGTLTC